MTDILCFQTEALRVYSEAATSLGDTSLGQRGLVVKSDLEATIPQKGRLEHKSELQLSVVAEPALEGNGF